MSFLCATKIILREQCIKKNAVILMKVTSHHGIMLTNVNVILTCSHQTWSCMSAEMYSFCIDFAVW